MSIKSVEDHLRQKHGLEWSHFLDSVRMHYRSHLNGRFIYKEWRKLVASGKAIEHTHNWISTKN